jgi:hypothetical protein
MESRSKTMKDLQAIPKFKNEDEERAFWATHDSADFVDWSKAQKIAFPNLKTKPKLFGVLKDKIEFTPDYDQADQEILELFEKSANKPE